MKCNSSFSMGLLWGIEVVSFDLLCNMSHRKEQSKQSTCMKAYSLFNYLAFIYSTCIRDFAWLFSIIQGVPRACCGVGCHWSLFFISLFIVDFLPKFKVGHHPPLAGVHVEGKEWVLYQEVAISSKFRGSYLQIIPQGNNIWIYCCLMANCSCPCNSALSYSLKSESCILVLAFTCSLSPLHVCMVFPPLFSKH